MIFVTVRTSCDVGLAIAVTQMSGSDCCCSGMNSCYSDFAAVLPCCIGYDNIAVGQRDRSHSPMVKGEER